MPINSSQEGREIASRGAGRPVGSITIETRRKLAETKMMNRRIGKFANKIISAQAIVAMGTHKMVRKYMGSDGIPHVETIRDEKTMQDLIDNGEYGKDYLILVQSMPDWKAGNALLDRKYGKAKETIDLNVDTKFSLHDLADTRSRQEKAVKAELIEPEFVEAEIVENQ